MPTIPDWQLPPGVDRGLWDYLHAADVAAGYDEQVRASPLAAADVAFCEKAFPTPGWRQRRRRAQPRKPRQPGLRLDPMPARTTPSATFSTAPKATWP